MTTIRIKLHDIPDDLHHADPIPCTVNDVITDAEFIRYGEDAEGNEWRRKIWVTVYGIIEVKSGVVRPDMFGDFTSEFTVNSDRTAWLGVG